MGNQRFESTPRFIVSDDAVIIQQAAGSSAPLLQLKDHTGSALMTVNASGQMSTSQLSTFDSLTVTTTATLPSGISLTSPSFSGTPTAPTATAGTNTTQVATTAFVRTEVSNLIASAPSALDTLDELAAALGDDPNFATTITNSLAAKAPIASPTFTGTVTLPSTTSIGDVSSTELGYLDGVTSALQTQLNAKAPLASPTFTGTVTVGALSSNGNVVLPPTTQTYFGSADGANSWRPIDQYGNSYFDINTGSLYIDSANYYFRNGSSSNLMTIDASANIRTDGKLWYSNLVWMGANVWDEDASWSGVGSTSGNRVLLRNPGTSAMYLISRAADVRIRSGTNGTDFILNTTAIYTQGRGLDMGGGWISTSNYIYGSGVYLYPTQQTLDGGSDNSGAIYISGTGGTATGGIEASWANATRPQISIGVTRDGSKVRSIYTYHGWGGLYTGNTRRVYWDGSIVEVTGTFVNNSTIRVKENIRPTGIGEFADIAPRDKDWAFSKFLQLEPVVFDYIEKPQDPIWEGCDIHDNRFACEAAKCENSDKTHMEEHVCDKGMCYGTLENPCPRYTQSRNRTHYIAEELAEVYPHLASYNDAREITGVDALAWRVEHANVTQHLIREVMSLREELAALREAQNG